MVERFHFLTLEDSIRGRRILVGRTQQIGHLVVLNAALP
jgi:hypothetical protein